ncbi:hypothetical protein K469DRAFT_579780 [Zopfia rhizophila CBS 207.26]|uniref:Survival Motor Neuron Gemin2-binding domain-containing protein n=1 Tax=Zopfia rhizophila CBS 207.26 TaxID=1314779 RepID=A0A6A6E0B7_9PEZI|nr:hypothetical protein K469DRAFT_579780 [Zopfia rhizophila CBS 207.26]
MEPDISLGDHNVWDDTALIDSWEEALAEYKRYHSIQARGKRLEDVLTEKELRELRQEHGDLIEVETRSGENDSNTYADQEHAGRIKEETNDDAEVGQDPMQEPTTSGDQEQSRGAETSVQPHNVAPAAMPQAILGTAQEENLKNLMMSWYYAGYYSGLYDRQQKAASEKAQEKGS